MHDTITADRKEQEIAYCFEYIRLLEEEYTFDEVWDQMEDYGWDSLDDLYYPSWWSDLEYCDYCHGYFCDCVDEEEWAEIVKEFYIDSLDLVNYYYGDWLYYQELEEEDIELPQKDISRNERRRRTRNYKKRQERLFQNVFWIAHPDETSTAQYRYKGIGKRAWHRLVKSGFSCPWRESNKPRMRRQAQHEIYEGILDWKDQQLECPYCGEQNSEETPCQCYYDPHEDDYHCNLYEDYYPYCEEDYYEEDYLYHDIYYEENHHDDFKLSPPSFCYQVIQSDKKRLVRIFSRRIAADCWIEAQSNPEAYEIKRVEANNGTEYV